MPTFFVVLYVAAEDGFKDLFGCGREITGLENG
jgi:hypothetical protein